MLAVLGPDAALIHVFDMALRQVDIVAGERLEIPGARRDPATADLKVRDEHLAQPGIVAEFLGHLLGGKDLHVALLRRVLAEHAESTIDVADDELAVAFDLLRVAEPFLIDLTILWVVAGVVAADQLRRRVSGDDPRWRPLKARHFGPSKLRNLGQDLDGTAAVADEADPFAAVVIFVVPARTVNLQAREGAQALDVGPLPMAQNPSSRYQNICPLRSMACGVVSYLEPPLSSVFVPLGILDCGVELDVSI